MRSLVVSASYDDEVDASYIQFGPIEPGEAARTVVVEDEDLGPLSVILDLDENGKLLGIELLNVSQLLVRPQFSDASP